MDDVGNAGNILTQNIWQIRFVRVPLLPPLHKTNNMAQQTAVEWLENIVNNMINNGGDLGEDYPALLKHIEQAKQMEKEQIIHAWEDGKDSFSTRNAEQYYNETYGGQGSPDTSPNTQNK